MNAQQSAGRRQHWLGWAIGLQLLVWTTSGVLFAWLPFESWVKAGDQSQRLVLAWGLTGLGVLLALLALRRVVRRRARP
jgi:hypothetical protein